MREDPGEVNRGWIMKGIINQGVQAMQKPKKEQLQRSEFFIFFSCYMETGPEGKDWRQ